MHYNPDVLLPALWFAFMFVGIALVLAGYWIYTKVSK